MLSAASAQCSFIMGHFVGCWLALRYPLHRTAAQSVNRPGHQLSPQCRLQIEEIGISGSKFQRLDGTVPITAGHIVIK